MWKNTESALGSSKNLIASHGSAVLNKPEARPQSEFYVTEIKHDMSTA